MDPGRRVQGHPLRGGRRRDRQDHHQPARGAQRVPAGDADRGLRRAGEGAARTRGRRDRPHRRGPARVLLRRRPARPRRHGLRARAARRSGASTSPTCTSRSAGCPSRWWRWSRATRSAAATCCTSSATSRSPPTTRASARPARASARSTAASARACCRPRRPEEGEGDLVPVPPVRRAAGARDGAREHRRAARPARGGDGAVVPRDARALPLRAAAGQGELPRRTRTAGPASSSSRTTPTSCSTPARRRRRGATPTRRSAPPTSPRSPRRAVSPPSIWLMAARPRTLPAAVAPVLVGTALAATADTFKPLTFLAALLGALLIQVGTNLSNDYSDARRGADTEDRLGPVRVTAGGARAAARRCWSRPTSRSGSPCSSGAYLIVDRGLGAAAGRRRLDPGRRALHRRPAPLRLRGAGRGLRVPVLRRRRGRRLLLRAGRGS